VAAYRHVQTYTVLWIILTLSGLVTLGVAAMVGPAGATAGGLVALPVLPVLPVLMVSLLLLGRLVIELDAQHLRWRFGYIGWPRWQLALVDIRRVERTRAPASAGSGIKGSKDKRLYNVTIGGPAVLLTLHDGRTAMLGTPEPERLAAVIEARLPPAG